MRALVLLLCALSSFADTVVVLHGILRSSSHMRPVENALKDAGYRVINLDYPSRHYPIESLTEYVAGKIEPYYSPDETIHFVGYSMGGLITRAILTHYRPPNLGHVVFLGVPHNGSALADIYEDNWVFQKVFGPAGKQLGVWHTDSLNNYLGPINYVAGSIAGNQSIDPISSFLLDGPDDGKVTVESTKIAGLKDHIVIKANHIFFPSNKKAIAQTIYFLRHGQFESSR